MGFNIGGESTERKRERGEGREGGRQRGVERDREKRI